MWDVEASILYSSDVFRKLIQEYNDKELGINSKVGNNPVLILQQLRHEPAYAGCIRQISIDQFHVQYDSFTIASRYSVKLAFSHFAGDFTLQV